MSIRQRGGRHHILTKFILISTEVPSKIGQWQNKIEYHFSWWLIMLNAEYHGSDVIMNCGSCLLIKLRSLICIFSLVDLI
jgi:hypothetical protein